MAGSFWRTSQDLEEKRLRVKDTAQRHLQRILWANELDHPRPLSVGRFDHEQKDDEGSEENDQPFKAGFRFYATLSIFLLMQFQSALDYTATGNILVSIVHSLQGTTSQAEWIGNAYTLAAVVMQLPVSKFSDIFGRKSLVVLSISFVLIGSLICGVSQNMAAMIAGRAIQGIGAAGELVLPEVFVADVVPLRLRGKIYAAVSVAWTVGSALSPIIGGAVAEYSTWRWFFYVNLPICGVALAACPFSLHLRSVQKSWRQQLKEIDFTGILLFISSTTSLLLALSFGGSTYEWSSWHVLVPLILGAVGLIFTAYIENRYIHHPIFNIRVCYNMSATLTFVQNVLQGLIMMGITYYLPIYFQGGLEYGTLASGAALLPLAIAGPACAVIGVIVTRVGHYQFITWICWGLATFGIGLYQLFDVKTSAVAMVFMQFPFSLGVGALYCTLSLASIASNPPELWTDSAAFMSFCRSFGDALGTAVGAAIFTSRMHTSLESKSLGQIDIGSAFSVVEEIRGAHNSTLKANLQNALLYSMRGVFWTFLGFSAFALLLNFFIREYSLNRKYVAKQGVDE